MMTSVELYTFIPFLMILADVQTHRRVWRGKKFWFPFWMWVAWAFPLLVLLCACWAVFKTVNSIILKRKCVSRSFITLCICFEVKHLMYVFTIRDVFTSKSETSFTNVFKVFQGSCVCFQSGVFKSEKSTVWWSGLMCTCVWITARRSYLSFVTPMTLKCTWMCVCVCMCDS